MSMPEQTIGLNKVGFFSPSVAGFGEEQDRLVDSIRAAEPGEMLLDGTRFSGFDYSAKLYGTFTIDDEFKRSRPHGTHKLQFGRLVLSSIDDYELPTQIVVKPEGKGGGNPRYDDSARALAHEWSANSYINDLYGYRSAFQPLGFWKSDDGVARLITEFEEPVKTFDQIFWAQGRESQDVTKEQMIKALRIGISAVGFLHGSGLIHGEPHQGNIGRDSTDRVRQIDLESLWRLLSNDHGVVNNKESRGLILADVQKLIGSLMSYTRPGEAIFSKIVDVLSDESAVSRIISGYVPSVRLGESRSGVTLPEKLALKPERIKGLFREELEKHKNLV